METRQTCATGALMSWINRIVESAKCTWVWLQEMAMTAVIVLAMIGALAALERACTQ